MTFGNIELVAEVADPSWDHPTIAHERGVGDASRGKPMRKDQPPEYAQGWRHWMNKARYDHPMRKESHA